MHSSMQLTHFTSTALLKAYNYLYLDIYNHDKWPNY